MATAEHDYDIERKRRKRAAACEVFIPAVVDPARRAAAEADIYLFLKTYFPEKFYNPFTDDHRLIVEEILYRAKVGGDKAVAAPRGEGKTTIAECVLIYCLLLGLLKFPVVVAATGKHANQILSNIKHEMEFNDLLHEDYPEVCEPIRALEGTPQRAAKQHVQDEKTHIQWSQDAVVLPTIAGSKASGAILKTFGLDAAIRGVKHNGQRPDFVLIDDPETRESADSNHQIATREETIERDIAGLGGQGRPLGRLVLCTLQNHKCLAAKLTDPKQKPSWGGKRYSLLKARPERVDLWDEYIRIKETGGETGEDPDGRKAQAFYEQNRAEMDRGAIVSNPERYFKLALPDGSQMELSALQHCYNIIAKIGPNSFATEYQNEPPLDDVPESSGVTASIVRSRLNGLPMGLVPSGCTALTAGVDVGKYTCHWVVIAWLKNATGFVLEHGKQKVRDTDEDSSDSAVERAIFLALSEWRDRIISDPYLDDDGQARKLDVALIDSGSGLHESAVYQFVRSSGGNPFRASKGFGGGHRQSPFRGGQPSATRKVGNNWYASKQQPHNIWLWGLNAGYWKQWTQERFLTEHRGEAGDFRPGSLSLWGDDERTHVNYSKQIVAEKLVRVFEPSKGYREFWEIQKDGGRNNHWLDATYMACAAADMCGVKLLGTDKPRTSDGPRPTLAQLAGRK